MTILHLGVLDLPYADAPGKKPKTTANSTTGEVAEILERKYGVMDFFYKKYGDEIADDVLASLQEAIESIELGAPLDIDPFGAALSKIEERFRGMLERKELDGLVPGVPTKASLKGHSKRFKKPHSKKRGPRPSFVDTGLFESAFRTWTDNTPEDQS